MAVTPPHNLDPNAAPWGRWATERIETLDTMLTRGKQDQANNNYQLNGSINVINEQVRLIREQQDSIRLTVEQLAVQQALLTSYQVVRYADSDSTSTNFSGWYTGSLPSVTLASATGRIEVGYGGSLNGGNGYICYQVVNLDTGAVIVNRNTIQQSPSRRIAITGGASFTPSGYRTEIVDVPVDANLRVTVQLYASDTYVAFLGSSVQAKVTP